MTGTFPVAILLSPWWLHAPADALPDAPVEIGTGPQFLFDNCLVDNYCALRYS